MKAPAPSAGSTVSTLRSGAPAKAHPPLRLVLVVDGATPWPALSVTVRAVVGPETVPVLSLRYDHGAYVYKDHRFSADPLDALLLRTLFQQPRTQDGVFLVGPREFAGVLALLRQHSPNVECREAAKIQRVEILDAPVEPVLEILPAPAATVAATAEVAQSGTVQARPAAEGGSVLQIAARTRFRTPEGDQELGAPLFRSGNYWTFQSHVAPAPAIPGDPLLRALFDGTDAPNHVYAGDEALDLICRARDAARDGLLKLRLDERVALPKATPRPLRRETRVAWNADGSVTLSETLYTPEGESVPAAAIEAGLKNLQSGVDATAPAWIQYKGRAVRLPEPVAHFRLPGATRLEGDALADFVLGDLARLEAEGAQIDPRVKNLRVCSELKPAVKIELADSQTKDVQAQWSFEAELPQPDGTAVKTEIAPLEILAAAARGDRYLRRGTAFIKVDREAVMRCRRQLEATGTFGGSAVADARGEQIPELLAWAKQAGSSAESPWNIYVAESVDGAHQIKDTPASVKFHVDAEEEENETWFTLTAEFDHGGKKLSEDELREMVKKGQRWFLQDGQWVKVDAKALERFELQAEEAGISRHGGLRGRRRQFYYRFKPASRDRVTDIFSLSGTIQHTERYRKFLDQLRSFDRIQSVPVPRGMKLGLRSYQQQGYEWLSFLAKYDLNGVLADDMGLGKTAQTIAVLTRMAEEFGRSPSLIVTPTSLVDNWKSEFGKFSPDMKVLIYRGSPERRDRLRQELGDYDVVLGTYATVRNDASLLRQVNWRYVILDEAHFIKNAAAATTKAMKTIPARHRLALTGTPIQNRLAELWSLFDFLMPDFLGRQARFREQYEDPIAKVQSGRAESRDEQETGEYAMDRLRDRIRPFVLRRLKTDVAHELPPKIENDVFCTLTPEQVAMYRSFADSIEAREAVQEIVDKGADGASTLILAALTSLRKICNHPDLMCLPKNAGRQRISEPMPGYENRSGKLEALAELLEQCREGGHRALIFCQQTTMLDILAYFLRTNGMKYLRIDGETPGTARQALVNEFNGDATIDCFLISTRAGGAGLNLTGADTVIFYDHDWNPANDQQAQDRAYRIGQQRTVNVYRLICKGTLEEKILRRQALKKALANSIVSHDIGGVKDLTREELLALFTYEEPARTGEEESASEESHTRA